MDFTSTDFSIAVVTCASHIVQTRQPFYDTVLHGMLRSSAARKLYLQTLLIVLLLFHYIYVSGHFGEFGVLFSTILCGILFSHKRAERWLHLIKAHRQLYFRMAVLSMAMVAIPHLYTMAVTVAFLLLAATFYPSASILYEWNDKEKQEKWRADSRALAEHYF